MFEEGARLKEKFGSHKIFDFSLGDPTEEPPDEFERIARALLDDERPKGMRRYTPTQGLKETRQTVAARFNPRIDPDLIVITSGAAGAINVAARSILAEDDEVIVIAPYFPEYLFYIANARSRAKIVESDPDSFALDPARIKQAISPKTRAIVINSPNNPTGALYSERSLRELARDLINHARGSNRPIFIIADEVYRKMLHDPDRRAPDIFKIYPNTLIAGSYSKELNIAGERIGYLAVNPQIDQADRIVNAATFLNRTLGFVNAPVSAQRIIARYGERPVQMSRYRAIARLMISNLRAIGYELPDPDGGFYLFPRSPIADDLAFIEILKENFILATPGRGFGAPGRFRLALTIEYDRAEKSIAGFERAMSQAKRSR